MNIQGYTPQILEMLIWPDERLTEKGQDVTIFDEALQKFAADMFITMEIRGGVGLAAPQCGVPMNMITIRLEKDNPLIIINPEITVFSTNEFEWEEGCLSVPGHFEKRKRPQSIGVAFKDLTGEFHTVNFTDLYAFAIQHEYDHLQGKCFVDKASMFKRERIKKKIKKALVNVEAHVEEKRTQLERMSL